MLFTASTVKDSPANVRWFVESNLGAGVDHMFVFLDAPREPEQREVAAWLTEQPRVTCVETGRSRWWGGDRPASLNVRQRINANWARTVLEPLDWATWLFHVDGDEVVWVDPDVLAAVPAGQASVRLSTWEAVSRQHADDRPTLFKQLLGPEELTLLHVLGVVDEPTNQSFFHGHVMGKSGVRPGSGAGLTLHDAVDQEGRALDAPPTAGLNVLHYDAISGDEFVRKWQALAGAGAARYRASRAPVARALKCLISADLDPAVRDTYLRRIFEITTEDDVATLDELGLLVRADPATADRRPTSPPPGGAEALAARVSDLLEVPKRPLLVLDRAKDKQPGDDDAEASTPRAGRERLRRMVRRS